MIGRALGWQVAQAFGIALPAGALLVAALQAVRLSPVAAAAGARASEWAPALGATALLGAEAVAPAAFGVAMVLVALRWHADGELLAARAAGLSMLRVARGPFAVAAAAAALVAVVTTVGAPFATRRLEATWDVLLPRAIVGAVRPGAMVEVLPGLLVYAARHEPGGALGDVVVAQGDTVVAARAARVRIVAGPALAIEAERGAVHRGVVDARFERLVLPVALGGEVELRRGAIAGRGPAAYAALRRASSPASFALVAVATVLAALLLAGRPARLSLAVAGLVAVRELGARVGELGLGASGGALGATLPVLLLLAPLLLLGAAAVRRDVW